MTLLGFAFPAWGSLAGVLGLDQGDSASVAILELVRLEVRLLALEDGMRSRMSAGTLTLGMQKSSASRTSAVAQRRCHDPSPRGGSIRMRSRR
jgi:hypothetical protein